MSDFQTSDEQSTEGNVKQGVPVWVWILSGCGCVGFAGFVVVPLLLAIALPSFINQANQVKASEGRSYTGSMNRAQQAYFLEEERFSETVADLGLGIAEGTENYQFQVTMLDDLAVRNVALPQDASGSTYAGYVWVSTLSDGSAWSTAQVCEGPYSPEPPPPIELPTLPTNDETPLPCPDGFTLLE